MDYNVITEDVGGAVMVTCPLVPEFTSIGDDLDEALLNAVDGMETALEIYIQSRRPWPVPSEDTADNAAVSLPALSATKALLHNEMLAQGVRKSDLAKKMFVAMPQVDRLLDIRHPSRLDPALFMKLTHKQRRRAVYPL